jgi:hypothetical protein
MLNNVLDIDMESMKVSIRSARGAIVLFDFQAAFPSLAHEYLWTTLSVWGVPHPLLNMLKCFYVNNNHIIKVKGAQFKSLTSKSGIRQGCPVSPLLFAAVVDLLLRRLTTCFPTALTRAFADDIGMVLDNFDQAADALMKEFREFGQISGLHLGMPKTLIIPLWQFNHRGFHSHLRDMFPEWASAQIQSCGKYLGVQVGPGRGDKSWDAALEKYEKRAEVWSRLPVGLLKSIQHYRYFVFSVLSFMMQVEEVPERALALEIAALRRFAPGPGNWIRPKDMFNLIDLFRFPSSFPSLRSAAIASKMRRIAHEAPDVVKRAREFNNFLVMNWQRPFPRGWYNRCHALVLLRASDAAEVRGVTKTSILASLSRSAPEPARERAAYLKKHFQKEAYKQLHSKGTDKVDVEDRLRAKLKRWKLTMVPRHSAERAKRLFQRLSALVPPRVMASMIRTLCNGWCTRRQFQEVGSCVFACRASASDAIEHYAFCPMFRSLLERLHLPAMQTLVEFFLLEHRLWSDARLGVAAVAIHALYTSFNYYRLNMGPRGEDCVEFMLRSCYHAVRTHARSAAFLATALSNTSMQ